jgi:hypothetical protein
LAQWPIIPESVKKERAFTTLGLYTTPPKGPLWLGSNKGKPVCIQHAAWTALAPPFVGASRGRCQHGNFEVLERDYSAQNLILRTFTEDFADVAATTIASETAVGQYRGASSHLGMRSRSFSLYSTAARRLSNVSGAGI